MRSFVAMSAGLAVRFFELGGGRLVARLELDGRVAQTYQMIAESPGATPATNGSSSTLRRVCAAQAAWLTDTNSNERRSMPLRGEDEHLTCDADGLTIHEYYFRSASAHQPMLECHPTQGPFVAICDCHDMR